MNAFRVPTVIRRTAVALILLCVGTGHPAAAAPITISFAGQITGATGPLISVGTAFSGTAVIDNAIAAEFTFGASYYYNAITAFSLTIGSYTVTNTQGLVQVRDNPDQLWLMPAIEILPTGSIDYGGAEPYSGTIAGYQIQAAYPLSLSLFDSSNTAFGDASLPGSGLTLADFTSSSLFVPTVNLHGEDFYAFGELSEFSTTEATAAPVPEPAPIALLGTGLAVLAGRRRFTSMLAESTTRLAIPIRVSARWTRKPSRPAS